MKGDQTKFTIARRDSLEEACISEMFDLLSTHFAGVARDQFTHDLLEKNWVVLIRRDSTLVGFSTLVVYETKFAGEPVSVVYSGDTIMAPEAWGSTTLARGWIAAVNRLREHYPRGNYYWLLLTSGFRTYRFLPVFWREFFPCYEKKKPHSLRKLRDHLAEERFGSQYDAGNGIVRFQHPQRLRGELALIPTGRMNDPHVAFFAANNPGFSEGDELVCLTELCPENLTRAGQRMVSSRTDEALCDHR